MAKCKALMALVVKGLTSHITKIFCSYSLTVLHGM